MTAAPVRIAVDALGGDRAPDVVTHGVLTALNADPTLEIVLVGPADVVEPFARDHGRVTSRVATESIAMDEHPANAVRTKKDSSIVVGCRLVKDGECAGFFSAGSTGAAMAAATLIMGRLPGVSRPAIAAVIPTPSRPSVLLDIGANADVKPENLLDFAIMGAAYASVVLGVPTPTVGLLNIGEEPTKGSLLAQEAHALLATRLAGFAGNVEGRDVPKGSTDVVVTDGFTGNVVLKVLEGLASELFGELKSTLTATPLRRAAAAILAPALREMRSRLDPDVYGGAPLLGVSGVCIIGHGSSGPEAIANGVRVTAQASRGRLPDSIARALAEASSA